MGDSSPHDDVSVHANYMVRKTPGAACGKGLNSEIKGPKKWLSIDAAIKQAEASGFVMGVTCCAIQKASGQTYWYGMGSSSGQGGEDVWSITATGVNAAEATKLQVAVRAAELGHNKTPCTAAPYARSGRGHGADRCDGAFVLCDCWPRQSIGDKTVAQRL